MSLTADASAMTLVWGRMRCKQRRTFHSTVEAGSLNDVLVESPGDISVTLQRRVILPSLFPADFDCGPSGFRCCR